MITEEHFDGAHRVWRDDPQAADDGGLCCHRRGWGDVVITDRLCCTTLFCREAGVGVDQLFTGWGKNRFTVMSTPLAPSLCFVGNTQTLLLTWKGHLVQSA